MDYIIVQAGGKGTRLKHLTRNKPKALIPVENLPMLFHLFRKYLDKKFIIIADYHREVLREYLAVFADVKYQIIDATGTGTCSGIKQALRYIPENESFMLIWSDLILSKEFKLPKEYESREKALQDYIGISKTFPCRWSYKDNMFIEEKSCEHGVAGFFLFTDKSKLKDVPESGELVRWISQKQMQYEEINLAGTKEFGILEEYEKLETEKCRPFNKITVDGDVLIKEPLDEQGEMLAKRECLWYEKANQYSINSLPKIYTQNPLQMELIKGKNIYECQINYREKKEILHRLVIALKELHNTERIETDYFSMKEAYFKKTMDRLSKIQDLVPFARERIITINEKKCRNVF